MICASDLSFCWEQNTDCLGKWILIMLGNQIDYNKTNQREHICLAPFPVCALIFSECLPSPGRATWTHYPSEQGPSQCTHHLPGTTRRWTVAKLPCVPAEDFPSYCTSPCSSPSCLQQGVGKSQRVANLQKSKCKKKKNFDLFFILVPSFTAHSCLAHNQEQNWKHYRDPLPLINTWCPDLATIIHKSGTTFHPVQQTH